MKSIVAVFLLSASLAFGQYAPPPLSTAAAGTLTGTTLAPNVTASSLTSVGTLTSLMIAGNDQIIDGVGSSSTPRKLTIGASAYSSNLTDDSLKLYLYDSGSAGGRVGISLSGGFIFQYHTGASGQHTFYINNVSVGTINTGGFSGNGSQITNLPAQLYSGSFSGAGTATTSFVVTIGTTQANTTYKVNVTPTAALSAAVFYISAKTTTTFTVTYLAGLTGTVTFDWSVFP